MLTIQRQPKFSSRSLSQERMTLSRQRDKCQIKAERREGGGQVGSTGEVASYLENNEGLPSRESVREPQKKEELCMEMHAGFETRKRLRYNTEQESGRPQASWEPRGWVLSPDSPSSRDHWILNRPNFWQNEALICSLYTARTEVPQNLRHTWSLGLSQRIRLKIPIPTLPPNVSLDYNLHITKLNTCF